MKKVCLITGVGPGTGSALVRRFAAGGYRVIMIARDAARLESIEEDVPAVQPKNGGAAPKRPPITIF